MESKGTKLIPNTTPALQRATFPKQLLTTASRVTGHGTDQPQSISYGAEVSFSMVKVSQHHSVRLNAKGFLFLFVTES